MKISSQDFKDLKKSIKFLQDNVLSLITEKIDETDFYDYQDLKDHYDSNDSVAWRMENDTENAFTTFDAEFKKAQDQLSKYL